jgi:hypothetical protein
MHVLSSLVRLAGATQLAIAAANFFLPKKLNYRDNLNRVAPIIREIFIVHSAYIVGVLLLFAAVSFAFAPELASGHGLGQFLAGAMAIFWFCRVPVQLLYYDRAVRRTHRFGDVAFTAATIFLAATYSAASIGAGPR